MAGALSPESQIVTILDAIGCAPSNFSDIVGRCSNSRVMAALKGSNDFDHDDAQYYLEFARQLKRLADDYPVPIAWKETVKIKEILAARTSTRPIPFAIVMIDSSLFKQVTNDGRIETATDYQACAAFKDELIARSAAKLLDKMGAQRLRTTTITNERRAAETIYSTLADFGFIE